MNSPASLSKSTLSNKELIEKVDNIKLHRKLVEVAYRWVLKNCSCGVAFKEFNTNACNGEYPDVIGFGSHGHSVLIECKTSRSDFHTDKKKSFRKNPSLGMGTQRFYCCPTGLIKVEDLPKGWGLIYVNEKFRATCVYSPYKGNIGERHNGFEKNIKAEHGLMYSALRRLHLRGHIDEIYNNNKMNKLVSFDLCTLSDSELIKMVDKLTDEMFATQKVPTRHIPARPNDDYDLLVGELIKRFHNMTKHYEKNSTKAHQGVENAPKC